MAEGCREERLEMVKIVFFGFVFLRFAVGADGGKGRGVASERLLLKALHY